MPPTQTLGPRAKKAQKCVFFVAGLSKITKPKNKKLQNNVSFFLIFMSHVKKQPSTHNFGKTQKIPQNVF